MIERSGRVLTSAGERELDDAGAGELIAVNDESGSRGLRVLAVASGEVEGTSEADLRDLTFVGFAGPCGPSRHGRERDHRDDCGRQGCEPSC